MAPPKKQRKPSAYNRHVGREMRAGRTMKQAAASWKKGAKKPVKRKRKTKRNVRKTAKKGIKILNGMGSSAILKDVAWGLGGLMVFSPANPYALPITRSIQGGLSVAGILPGSKRRLAYGILDLLDLKLAEQLITGNGVGGFSELFAPVRNLLGLG